MGSARCSLLSSLRPVVVVALLLLRRFALGGFLGEARGFAVLVWVGCLPASCCWQLALLGTSTWIRHCIGWSTQPNGDELTLTLTLIYSILIGSYCYCFGLLNCDARANER